MQPVVFLLPPLPRSHGTLLPSSVFYATTVIFDCPRCMCLICFLRLVSGPAWLHHMNPSPFGWDAVHAGGLGGLEV